MYIYAGEETFTLHFFLCQVVITVFVETDASSPVPEIGAEDGFGDGDAEQPTLIFNLYCPKLSKSVDIDLPHAMQKTMAGDIFGASFYEIFANTQTTDVSRIVSCRSAATDLGTPTVSE